jgi:hypothetical protein
MRSQNIGVEFSLRSGIVQNFKSKIGDKSDKSSDLKLIILLVALDNFGIETLIVELQTLYPNVVIIGGLCQVVYNRPSKVNSEHGDGGNFFGVLEGTGIAGIAMGGNISFKPLIAHPIGAETLVRLRIYLYVSKLHLLSLSLCLSLSVSLSLCLSLSRVVPFTCFDHISCIVSHAHAHIIGGHESLS